MTNKTQSKFYGVTHYDMLKSGPHTSADWNEWARANSWIEITPWGSVREHIGYNEPLSKEEETDYWRILCENGRKTWSGVDVDKWLAEIRGYV